MRRVEEAFQAIKAASAALIETADDYAVKYQLCPYYEGAELARAAAVYAVAVDAYIEAYDDLVMVVKEVYIRE